MSNTAIEIQDEAVQAVIDRVIELGADPTLLTRPLSGDLLSIVESNFAAEGRPSWTPLAPSTIKAREKRGTWPGKILQESGRLAASQTPAYDQESATVGTNVVYARIQNEGGTVHMPARSQQMYFKEKGGEVTQHFVAKVHSNFAQWATRGAHDINIPARPFYLLTDDDWNTLFDTTHSVLERILQNSPV